MAWAMRRIRPLRATLVVVALAAAPARGASERQAFIDRYHCEMTSRLAAIRDTPAPKNKFIAVSPVDAPGSYVQCLFTTDGRSMLCEAASGYYRVTKGEPWSPAVTPGGLEALGRLGFETTIGEGNFSQEIAITDGTDLERVATTILGALFDGYGVRLGRDLKVNAPLSDLKGLMSPTCTPSM